MGLWDIDKIPYVGREKGPQEGLAFHYYDADKVVAGKKMKDWLRFGVAWWHTFDQELVDPFGTGTAQRPWYGKYSNPEDEALAKVDYAFEFFQKLGVEYFCFHDRDIAPEGDTLRETDKNLDKVVDKIEENMKSTGIKLLWNTSSLFTNPRFVSGASTSPFADIYAYAGGQLKHSLEIAKRLGAEHAIIAYRRTEDEMPCRRAELHHAKAEGVEVLPLVSPLEFVAGEDGSVCAVKVQKMELGEPDESGRRRPVPIEGAIEEIPCDVAISAIGTNANPFAKKIGGKMELNKWGYIVADEETGQTTDPRIWAGGDIVTGAATVILAMGAGQKAAASITKSLLGE